MFETPSSHRAVQYKNEEVELQVKNKDSNSEKSVPLIHSIPQTTTMIQCCIERSQESSVATSNLRLTFKYQVQKGKEVTVMVAEKQFGSKYYIFDCSRIGVDAVDNMRLNKKAGNYIGKLTTEPSERALYTLNDARKENQELMAISYDVPSLITQWRNGQPPRKIQLVVHSPLEDRDESTESLKVKMMQILKARVATESGYHFLRSKEPMYEGGQYRLNFGGRVSVASVKNMQIVNGLHDLVFQFGKVGHDKFHLDYK